MSSEVAYDSLEAAEAVIEDELSAFIRVGRALEAIRDSRLYRRHEPPWETFETYCRDRWEFGRSYADRTIAAARVVGVIETESKDDAHGHDLYIPPSERVARELVPVLAVKGGSAAAETWRVVRERYDDQDDGGDKPISATDVRRVVADLHPELIGGRTTKTPLEELTDVLVAYEPRARALLKIVGHFRHQSLSDEMRDDLRAGADRVQAQADALRALADGRPPQREELMGRLGLDGS